MVIPMATALAPFASKHAGQAPKSLLYVDGEGCDASVSIDPEKMRSRYLSGVAILRVRDAGAANASS